VEPVVQCVDLWKIYHTGKVEVPALRGVNMEVREGEFVAIMGPSGCGKSTLLYVLGGHDRQTYQAKTGFQNAEVATVNADGTLTPFATVPGLGVPGVPYARNGVQLGNFFYLLGSEVTGNAIIDQLPLQ